MSLNFWAIIKKNIETEKPIANSPREQEAPISRLESASSTTLPITGSLVTGARIKPKPKLAERHEAFGHRWTTPAQGFATAGACWLEDDRRRWIDNMYTIYDTVSS